MKFISCLNHLKGKATEMDHVPPHLQGRLPEYAKWTLYRYICAIWTTGVLSTSWTDARITLLYKKGDPRDASNYRPIAVYPCMY